MSQWIKSFPIKPIYFSFLLIWLFFVLQGSQLALLGLVLLLLRLAVTYPKKKLGQTLLFLGIFTGIFLGRTILEDQKIQSSPNKVEEISLLPDTIKVNGDSLSFRGKSQGYLYQVYYKLQSENEKRAFQNLSDVTQLQIEGELGLAEEQRNFAGFDYRTYLKTQGIYQTLKISQITSAQSVWSWSIFENLSSLRRRAIVHIQQDFPQPMSHYMTGLLLGYLDTDFDEMNDLYSSLGIIHLFALSGMQVGFFMDGFRKILLRLGLKMETVDFLQFPFSLFYAGLTGFSVSVVRSLIQKLLAQLGFKSLDNFAVTILLLFLLMPSFLLTAGGVLSCAYAFIISMIDLDGLGKYKKLVVESLVISLGILPILLFYFSEFQLWSIFFTFAFSFLFDSFFLPVLTLAFSLSFLVKLTFLNGIFLILEAVIRWVASLSPLPIVFGKPSGWLLLALLLTLALLHDCWKLKKVRFTLIALTVLLFFICKMPLENEITVVDIGQGDSIFLRDVTGRNVLIDVGGRVDFGVKEEWQKRVTASNAEKTLIPYLKSRGMSQIDRLVLTHTDTDHMGDMLEVAKALPVKEVYVSKGSMTQLDFVEKLAEMKSQVHVVEVGDQLPIFDSQLEVLYPSETGDGGNDDSVVLYGEFFQTKFLFTGDLEAHGEKELLTAFPNLQVDVLKAGHHGSKGSSSPEFLAAIKPRIALISAGKNNRYKHPHQETLERFETIASQIYRTDQQGAIRFKGWTSWHVETVR